VEGEGAGGLREEGARERGKEGGDGGGEGWRGARVGEGRRGGW